MLAGLVVFFATPSIAQMKPVVEKAGGERTLQVSLQVTDLCTTNPLGRNQEGNSQWEVIIDKVLSASADPMSRAGNCNPQNDDGRLLDDRDAELKFLYEKCPGPFDGRVIYTGRSFPFNH